MSLSQVVCLVIPMLLLALPALAEDAPPVDAPEPEASSEAPVEPVEAPSTPPMEPAPASSSGNLLHGRLELSLDDGIRMGLENNLGVQVARYSPVISGYDEEIAWGAYDPNLFAEFGYSDVQQPNSNVLFGTNENVNRSTDGFGGFRGIVPLLGTEYAAQFDGGRGSTNNSISALSPEYTSSWALSITQPVLRDLIWNQPWTQVRSSELLRQSSDEDFREAVMDTVRGIEIAYWTLVANDEAQRVARKSLETAQALLDQTRTQYDVGVVSKVEVTEAEAGLSQRQVNLIRAENTYRNQQDVLINLVLGPGLRSASTLEIMAIDRPDDFTEFEVDVESAVSSAFENRPELQSAQREIERQEVQLQFAKNQRLPELDGIFSFGQSGLAGDSNDDFNPCRFSQDPLCNPNDPALDPSQGDWDRNFDDYDDSPTFTARARLSIPFPNTVARKNASKTEIQLRRARTLKRRLEQDIIIQVRRAARDLSASQEGIVAAQSAEKAAAEQLRAERIRLEYGESTPFDVLQREEDLVDRENELIGAFQAYLTSAVELDRAQGTILRNRNIQISEVRKLR